MLKGFPLRTRAVFLTAALLLILLAGHLISGREADSPWSGGGFRSGVAPARRPPVKDDDATQVAPLATTSTSWTRPKPSVADWQPAHDTVDLYFSKLDEKLPCQDLEGAEDVVVIMRTGATEIQDKLPVHFNTTFQCYKDLVIFSDYSETFMDHPVHDVLQNVDTDLKHQQKDFELYLRLQDHGRESLHEDELSGKASFEGGKGGKTDNAGWRLDKWKFLPMMGETLHLRPDKKFYLFVESDSYVIWSNMLKWLKEVDHTKALYAGSEVQIGPDIFAHGGSVFLMTNSAVQKGAAIYEREQEKWNAWTAGHWAGDCVLGKALHEAGVELTWSWPMFQGGQPEKMDFTEQKGHNKQLWCAPALTYHHFSPLEMQRIWNFEQSWIRSKQMPQHDDEKRWNLFQDYGDVLHHREVFKTYIWPNLTNETPEWNNLSPDRILESEGRTFDECRQLCEAEDGCVQFSLAHDGCWISTRDVMLGQAWADVRSGWMLDRIQTWMDKMDDCDGRDGWTVTT